MRSTSPLSALCLTGYIFAAGACAPGTVGSAPDVCSEPALLAAYEKGSSLGSLSEALCEDDTCDSVPAAPAVTSEAEGACVVAGVKHGQHGRRSRKRERREAKRERRQCRADGKVVGQTAAALYCDLSILLGGLGEDELLIPGEASNCSGAFENACTRAFDKAARKHAKVVGDPTQDCTPFIDGEFRAAYEIARFNQCLFSIGIEPPPPDDCSDGSCECRDVPSCDLNCTGPDCDVLCERTETCAGTCGDDCDFTCRDLGTCQVEAGAGSDLLCERADTCDIDAGGGGKATCRDAGTCNVTSPDGGDILCEKTDTCNITCIGPECDVTCRKVGECNVEIDEGTVTCDKTGDCNVTCADGRKARRKGKHKRKHKRQYVCEKPRDGGSCSDRRSH